MTEATQPHVVIAGGGVAALEALIALRELAGDRLRITLLAPDPDFVYRAMAVAEPFGLGHAAHRALAEVTREFGATFVNEAVAEVDAGARRVIGGQGAALAYDSLLIAVGARPRRAYRHGITFGSEGAPEALAGLLSDLELGYAKRVTFVVPSTVAWSLPLYELAVMTARDVWSAGIDGVEFTFVTPEQRPLEVFGNEGSSLVAELLAAEGIEFIGSTTADVGHGFVIAGDRRIDAGRTVTLPIPEGPRLAGLPADPLGFIPVDEHCAVHGLDRVFAAGDATTFPIKQGGLAAQQAVAAAEAIAARHGAQLEPRPYRPVLRGMLLTGSGGQSRWLRGSGGAEGSGAALHALWWPPTKIASRYLAPYLLGREAAEFLASGPEAANPVERDLEYLASPREAEGTR